MKVLTSSTEALSSKKQLNQYLAELYGLQINDGILSIGDHHDINIQFTMPDVRFIKDDILNEVVTLIKSMFFDRSSFNEDVFNDAKRLAIETIETTKERKYEYAVSQFLSHMFEKTPLKKRLYGTIEDIQRITLAGLLDYYEQHFLKDTLLLYVSGHLDIKQEKLILNTFTPYDNNQSSSVKLLKQSFNESQHIDEYLPMKQALVFLGYSMPIDPSHALYTAASLTNYLIGGSPESLLFKLFREHYQLAYDVESDYGYDKNSLLVYANTDADNYVENRDKLISMIGFYCESGPDLDTLELQKKAYINLLLLSNDYQERIVLKSLGQDLFGIPADINETIKRIKAVTVEDIKDCLSLLTLQLSYTLHGGVSDETESF